jgi:hypothetical protein
MTVPSHSSLGLAVEKSSDVIVPINAIYFKLSKMIA